MKIKKTGTYTPLNLDTNSVNTIRQNEGSDKIFVIMGQANKQSLGLRFAVASTSPLAGAMINRPVGQYYSIHLVNLKANQVEWTKSGRIDTEMFEEPVIGTIDTRDEMLEPFYGK